MPNDPILTKEQITKSLAELTGWELRDNWIRREYKTPGFSHTMMLVQTVGFLAEAANHHPDLSVGYANVTVKLQSHKEGGITARDIELAEKIHDVVTWQPADDSALDGFPKNWIH